MLRSVYYYTQKFTDKSTSTQVLVKTGCCKKYMYFYKENSVYRVLNDKTKLLNIQNIPPLRKTTFKNSF